MIKRIEYLYTLYNNIFAYTPLLHSFYEEYIGQDKDVLLSYLILPLVLNETSRNKLVKLTARSSLFTFCKYEECIIGLPERIKQYKAVTNDCIQYGVDRGLFTVSDSLHIEVSKLENSENFIVDNDKIKAAKKIAMILKSFDIPTIYRNLGVAELWKVL